MTTQSFYADLPALTEFPNLANPNCYVQAPDDWYVLITDITGSTQEIAAGRYREVNMLGASSIIAVLNTVRPLEIPFIFGGDGASLLVPPAYLGAAREALLGVRAWAHEVFGINLRVGSVPVATVNQHSCLKVAKYRLAPHYHQASFMGGGITYATELIKQNPSYRLDVAGDSAKADLTGLECRWREVPSPRGQTISLIVAATDSRGEVIRQVYEDLLKTIRHIYGEAENYHPIASTALRLSLNPVKLMTEVRARSLAKPWSQLKYVGQVWLANLLGAVLMGLKLKVGRVDWGRYKEDVCIAADYQKIDDVLRMVISGSPAQTEQLLQYLEHHFRAGHVVYGLHVSNRTLLTCMILDRCNCHFHLIDGANGGYAAAAKILKSQLHRQAYSQEVDAPISTRTSWA